MAPVSGWWRHSARSVDREIDGDRDVVGKMLAGCVEAVGCHDISHLPESVGHADVIDMRALADVASFEEVEVGEGPEVGQVEAVGQLRSHSVGAVTSAGSGVASLVEVTGHDQSSSLLDQCGPFA